VRTAGSERLAGSRHSSLDGGTVEGESHVRHHHHPGEITVESVSGKIGDDSLFAYINTAEKYVAAETPVDNEVVLYVDERTRRRGERILNVESSTWDDSTEHPFTVVRFPEGFVVSVERGRYAVRVIGVRKPADLDHDLPVTVLVE